MHLTVEQIPEHSFTHPDNGTTRWCFMRVLLSGHRANAFVLTWDSVKFQKTNLSGPVEIRLQPHFDERGLFARAWCQEEFERQGLNSRLVQCNISYNEQKGTLRGMHYQVEPFSEAKVVRCTSGAIYDVVIDLHPQSPSYRQWFGVMLSAKDRNMLYVPEGFAHGLLTLEDHTEIFYQMSEFYHPEASRGIRWNDPAFQIRWPDEIRVISERDRTYPDFLAL